MCSVIILFRPGHDWPILWASNRDEMLDRPWLPPARHWSDRPEVMAGKDELAGGTWLGVNDAGLIAGILNRRDSLGPAPGKRSRGELVLDALDFADARDAVEMLTELDTNAYRPFNMVLADNTQAFWLRNRGEEVEAFYTFPNYWPTINKPQDFKDLPLWIADYRPLRDGGPAPKLPIGGGWADWTYWQFAGFPQTNDQFVPGIGHGVDLNLFNGTAVELQARVFKNLFTPTLKLSF